MRKLILIRHAKSSWNHPELDDHERPLNKRGQRDSITMARHFADKDQHLDVIYSSTAIRAIDYAQMLSEFTNTSLVPDLSFYTFSDEQLLEILRSLPNAAHSVAVVAHNPAITHVTNLLIDQEIARVPTSAMIEIACPIESWSELGEVEGGCELLCFDYPKMLV